MKVFKNYKSILSLIILVFILSVLMIGCNSKDSSINTQNNIKETNSPKEKDKSSEVNSLLVYCAGGLKKPMEQIGKEFEKKHNIKINYTFGHSGQIISQAEISKKGDALLVATNEDYEKANSKKLVDYKKDLVQHIPAIAVAKGNPANIKELKDLTKPGLKVIYEDESSPLGKLTAKLLNKSNIYENVKKNVVATFPTVNELVLHLSENKGDASIIWEDNILQSDKLEVVSIPEEQNLIKLVSISTLVSSINSKEAKKFVDFVSSKEGQDIFKKFHLKPVNK
ncbi:molybdate ABC transporter, periplasmic molybdate-binding protein ModA [Gottschalkia purinilytica]|uniref:Molybdate ABC transporter, periplasmic molybdate-binding protein ModA n=1 Tax=Gottschalkia purinilytica TaxID=1503 RepID=A0A0L0W8Y9_GOTPU|nr:molybdate ABC transporter substrate-binding protein [Gottschalkia purinilytica]KNF07921.1 molybdate ABC transporter, periplasmic molybdate-binding protein ModA [Gottschalkia purinilytica]